MTSHLHCLVWVTYVGLLGGVLGDGHQAHGQYQQGGPGGLAGDAQDAFNALGEAIPGQPGEDYPIFSEVPETSFACDGQVEGGYYADPEAECQVFHICAGGLEGSLSKFSFLCPNGSLFNQEYFVCDWWFNVDCSQAESLYSLNDEIAAEREANSPSEEGTYGGQSGGQTGSRAGSRRGSSGQKRAGSGARGAASSVNSKYAAPANSYSSPAESGYASPAESGYASPAESGYASPADSGYASPDQGYGAPSGQEASTGYVTPLGSSGGYEAPAVADQPYLAPGSGIESYGGVQPARRRGQRTGRRGLRTGRRG